VPSTVALTITTEDNHLAAQLEPGAPSPSERIRAAQDLIRKGIPVAVRIDPIIPNINDRPDRLIAMLAGIGVKHITSSTYKPKPDNWSRLTQVFPDIAEGLKPFYFKDGERIGGNILLPKDYRFRLLKNVRDLAIANGMKFGVCREGLTQLNTSPCDGSWMLNTSTR